MTARPGAGLLLVFYLACLLGAGYAQLLAIIPGTGISIWLPSGLLTGALLTTARKSWPWWIAAAAAAEFTGNALWFGNSIPVSLLIIAGNVAEAVVGAYLIGRLVAWPFRLATIRDVLGLVLLGAVLAPLVAATVGSLTLLWSDGQPLLRSFPLFWIGDATGVLIAAPAVVVLATFWRNRTGAPAAKWAEIAALALASGLVAAASLTGRLPFGLMIIPLILLAAARFHFFGSTAASLGLTLLSAAFQVTGVSPFILVESEFGSHVRLQLFLAIAAFSTLIVAALAKQNAETLQRLTEANRELERRVLERTASLGASEARLKRTMETAQVGIAFGNERAEITDGNAALARLLGRPAGTLGSGSLTWHSTLADGERTRFQEEMKRLASEGRVGPLELVFVRPDGTTVPTIWTAAPLDNGEHVAFVVDQTEQKRHEEHIGLLMRELSHRAKNILTLVQSVARQTRAGSVSEFRERFGERIRALAESQNLLVDNDWSGAPLEGLVRGQLSHFHDALDSRISISGPPLVLTASAAQTIGLAMHELATNAGKYGALSNETGHVAIAWELLPDNRLKLSWTETGGPPVREPEHRGFGSTVIEAMVKASLGCNVVIAYDPAGLRWLLEGPLTMLLSAPAGEAGPP